MKKNKIDCSETYLGRELEEIKQISKIIKFPAILKPEYSADWRNENVIKVIGRKKAIFINSTKDLIQNYKKLGRINPTVLVQEYIEGDDSDIYTFCSYCNKNSDVICFFNTRKIIQVPKKLGTGILVHSTNKDDIKNNSINLLKKLKFKGVSEIEYKKDKKTGKYILIEINPRFWDQHQLSRSNGINLPLVMYHDKIGEKIFFQKQNYKRASWIAEYSFFVFIIDLILKRKGHELLQAIKNIKGKRCYATWDNKDPLPFIISMIFLFLNLLASQSKKLCGKSVKFGEIRF